MKDDDLYWSLVMSLDPDDNARARWLAFLRVEQDKILRPYIKRAKAAEAKRQGKKP